MPAVPPIRAGRGKLRRGTSATATTDCPVGSDVLVAPDGFPDMGDMPDPPTVELRCELHPNIAWFVGEYGTNHGFLGPLGGGEAEEVQHQRQPQREEHAHEDHAHEAHRAEWLALKNVGDEG